MTKFRPALGLLALLLAAGCTGTPISVTVLPSTTPPPDPSRLTRGPYLQSVTPNSIIVAWEIDPAAPSTISWGETESYGQQTEDPRIATHHAVTLTQLISYTLYHYQVQVGGRAISQDNTFRTAAGPDQTTFGFVVYGDSRTQEQPHQAVVDRILTLPADFGLHTGDLIAHGQSDVEWQTFFEIEQELLARLPLFPTMGNHEANAPLYQEIFYLPGNERWYSFDYGHAHFVCLQVDGIIPLTTGDEQMQWLEADLAATDQPWKFVYFHVPPYSSINSREDQEIAVRQTLAPIMARYGVQLVFSGHDHNYQRLQVGDTTYLISGGGGAPLYAIKEQIPELVAYAIDYHAIWITLQGPTLTAVALSTEGEALDHFTLQLGQ